MTTIKLKLEKEIEINEEQRIFNDMVRISYNRCHDGFNAKQSRAYLKRRFPDVNCWIVECARGIGQQVFDRFDKEKKVYFGGIKNYNRFMKGLISKEEFKQNRLMPITICGEQQYHGNRMFDFDLPNRKITLKLSRKDHRELAFQYQHKKIANNLMRLQELIDAKQITVTVQLTRSFICLSFDESKIIDCNFKNLKKNRVLGIDMNPNYIGLSVLEFGNNDNFKVLHKQVFDLSTLTYLPYKSIKVKRKYLTNKLHHETIHIAYNIANLVDYWKCDKVVLEDLNIKSSDKKVGKTKFERKRFNRLCNNVWNRRLFTTKLKSLSLLCNFSLVEVNPCYTSLIGNVLYGDENTPDMIAASIEIGRRGYKKFEKHWFYPQVSLRSLDEQWKQTLSGVKSWKELYCKVKELEVKYRFQLRDYVQNAVLSKFYKKKYTSLYQFV